MPDMNPILARFQHEPAMVVTGSTAWFEACVENAAVHLATIEASTDAMKMVDDFWFEDDDWRAAFRPYNVSAGVLTVPVKGALLNGFPWQFGNWATGYDYIWKAIDRGIADPAVRGIALVIDSPGGMVAGNFDLVDRMFDARGKKPIKAYAAEAAYSAAYSIASAADDITVTRSGGVGSVGVVTMHVDMSSYMDKVGLKVTFIFAGKHKVDGNAYEALSKDVKERIQTRIDASYSEFVAIVARNRGMSEEAVRKTEALTYSANEALAVGFADKIGALDVEITAFQAIFKKEDEDMADKAISESDLANARTEGKAEGLKDGEAKGFETGVKAANDRFKAILGSDAAKTRPNAALNVALKTSMTSEEAADFLATLAEEGKSVAGTEAQGAGAPKGMMDAAMDATQPGNPAQGKDGKTSAAATDDEKYEADMAAIAGFGLAGFKQPAK